MDKELLKKRICDAIDENKEKISKLSLVMVGDALIHDDIYIDAKNGNSYDFDKMFERLERSFETEKQFTADASHELRTPVAVIKGACEYSEKYDEKPNEYQETLAMIHKQADKMSVLISQLLSMTRMEQGIEYNKMTCLDLGKFTKQFIKEQQWD